jgi:hypothetical protein
VLFVDALLSAFANSRELPLTAASRLAIIKVLLPHSALGHRLFGNAEDAEAFHLLSECGLSPQACGLLNARTEYALKELSQYPIAPQRIKPSIADAAADGADKTVAAMIARHASTATEQLDLVSALSVAKSAETAAVILSHVKLDPVVALRCATIPVLCATACDTRWVKAADAVCQSAGSAFHFLLGVEPYELYVQFDVISHFPELLRCASPTAVDSMGQTVLHVLARRSNREDLWRAALLESKLDVCAVDANGDTAFHVLAREERPPEWTFPMPDSVQVALCARNRVGHTPLDVARTSWENPDDWIALLAKWGTKK